MKVIIEAPVFGQSGFEVISRGIALALDALGVDVQVVPKTNWNVERCLLPHRDVSRLEAMIKKEHDPEKSYHLMQQIPSRDYLSTKMFLHSLKSFCFTLFETNRAPALWVSLLNCLTGTFVFSDFNKKTFTDSGVNNIDVIPFGVDCKLFNPSVKPCEFDKNGDYVFITNGDFTERKNFEGLVESFVKEFTSKDKVRLIIKAHYMGFVKKYQRACINRIKGIVRRFNSINPPRIDFFGEMLPWPEVPRFYTAGDCFVLVSRGEGIGLPYAEALACGVPVITADFGGQMQFLNNDNSLIIPCDIRVIDDSEYIRKCPVALNHMWGHPRIPEVRRNMRMAYEMRYLMKEKGKQGRADMEKLTWQKAGLSIIEKFLK